jgi:hypothetical protein
MKRHLPSPFPREFGSEGKAGGGREGREARSDSGDRDRAVDHTPAPDEPPQAQT